MKTLEAAVIASLFVLVLGAPAPGDEKADKKQAELKWAKGVATDFLKAVTASENEQAEQLMTADLKKSVGDANWLLRVYNAQLRKGHTITEEQIAPDQDEASFKGLLQGEKHEADYSLRVVREKDSGRWRVAYFHFEKVREIPASKK
jgi:hypothetical protein